MFHSHAFCIGLLCDRLKLRRQPSRANPKPFILWKFHFEALFKLYHPIASNIFCVAMFLFFFCIRKECITAIYLIFENSIWKPLWIYGIRLHCFKVHSHMFGVGIFSNRNVYVNTCSHSSIWHRILGVRTPRLRNENLRNAARRRYYLELKFVCNEPFWWNFAQQSWTFSNKRTEHNFKYFSWNIYHTKVYRDFKLVVSYCFGFNGQLICLCAKMTNLFRWVLI